MLSGSGGRARPTVPHAVFSSTVERWFHKESSIMAVGDTLGHIGVSLLLLWIGVSLFISGPSQVSTSQHFMSPEVVIPLKMTGRNKGAKAPGWLSYSLRFGGQRHIIHMKVKKLLVSTHLPVFTYTDQHALLQDQPFVGNDCYYHGYVEGARKSLVVLSTCFGGFRGMLQINDLVYEMEPIWFSATFEHLVYKIDSNETEFPPVRCGLTEEISHKLVLQLPPRNTLKQSSYMDWWTHWRFLELGVVVDHIRFLFSQSNVSIVQHQVINVINIVDSFYYPFELDVILTGIEIWTQNNEIITNVDLDDVVVYFALWKHNYLDARLHSDATHLFIRDVNVSKLGVAYVQGICQKPFNCGVDVFEDNHLVPFAITLSHELGHNLGMLHDTETCVCELQYCVMYAYRKLTNKFSNCSYSDYWNNTYINGLCIFPPISSGNIFRLNYCGNRVVEEGEECDCGNIHQCAKDPCCLLNCSLSPGSACAFGMCCEGCKFKPAGTLCRQQANDCDLPEWCNGTSHQCPNDVYMQDGISCTDSAYCYKKSCSTHDIQCKEIFGQDARSASQSCYNQINTQGTRFGHCDIGGTVYVKCLTPDIMCGRVQCENVGIIPNLREHSTVHQFHFNDTTCWGTDYHLGIAISDIGHVKDGTVCGPGKICIQNKCTSMVHLPQSCQPDTCNGKGVCNNKQHCHCNQGWAPPYCKYKGYGGSVDSGPAPKNGTEHSYRRNLTYLSPLLLIPLIALCFCCFFIIYKKQKRQKRVQEKDKEEEEDKYEEEDKDEEKEKD